MKMPSTPVSQVKNNDKNISILGPAKLKYHPCPEPSGSQRSLSSHTDISLVSN